MKRLLSILLLAVILPSVVLAWMALRSLRDQQFILERQQALLHQEIVDGLARDVNNLVLGWQSDFAQTVRRLEGEEGGASLDSRFDDEIREALPWVEVGFVRGEDGELLAPQAEQLKKSAEAVPPEGNPAAFQFLEYNGEFLADREPAMVFASLVTPRTVPEVQLDPPSIPQDFGKTGEVSLRAGLHLSERHQDALIRELEKSNAAAQAEREELKRLETIHNVTRERLLELPPVRGAAPDPKTEELRAISEDAAPETAATRASSSSDSTIQAAGPLPARLAGEGEDAPMAAAAGTMQQVDEAPAPSAEPSKDAEVYLDTTVSQKPLEKSKEQNEETLDQVNGALRQQETAGASDRARETVSERWGAGASGSTQAATGAPEAQASLAQSELAVGEGAVLGDYSGTGAAPVDVATPSAMPALASSQPEQEVASDWRANATITAPAPAAPAQPELSSGQYNASIGGKTMPRRALTKRDFSELQNAKLEQISSYNLDQQQQLQMEVEVDQQGGAAVPASAQVPVNAPAPVPEPEAAFNRAAPVDTAAARADDQDSRDADDRPDVRRAIIPQPPVAAAKPAAPGKETPLAAPAADKGAPERPKQSADLAAAPPHEAQAEAPPPEQAQRGSWLGSSVGDMRVVPNLRNVSPQKVSPILQEVQVVSSARAIEADFASITQGAEEGCIARLQKSGVNLLLWRRSTQNPERIYGVQISTATLLERLRELVWVDENLGREVCLTLLDHAGKPVALSAGGFDGNWRKPFVATEIGDILPYWEATLYLLDPQRFTHSAETLRWTLGGMVTLLVVVIALGAGYVSREVAQRMHEARQKTDFVSNVSHELKTPLTSIRMFSELLAENRVQDPTRQKQYLNIIVSEAGRLTRLINNVLDFARMERGEKRYRMESLELSTQLREIAGMLTPNLQEQGLRLLLDLPAEGEQSFPVLADADALAQVWVNLVCNAEKYAASGKEISVRLERGTAPTEKNSVRVIVEDRGPGVPRGLEKRIFQQFFRADDSLAASVQGSGLGLTLARQIVESHRGRIWYEARSGGGSRFVVELPLLEARS